MEHAEAAIHGRGEPPELPWQIEHVWRWFGELCAGRAGLAPLTYPDIDAWSRLTGAMVRPSEVGLIKRLDYLWLKLMAAKQAQPANQRVASGSDPAAIKSALRSRAK